METSVHKYLLGSAVKEGESEGFKEENIVEGHTKEGHSPENFESTSSDQCMKGEYMDQLKSVKAEINEVMEENHRLRMCLDQILKDYQTLQNQYKNATQLEANKYVNTQPISHQDHKEEPELISLSLGRSSSETRKNVPCKMPIIEGDKEELSLGLDCKFEVPKVLSHSPPISSPESSLKEVSKEIEETWPPHKTMKNSRDGGDDEALQQNAAKKARVSVRYRCDTPTMNDGCQWRKYGQKISKGNPCPRAYYRCTVAPACPVRKQVQRCVEDMSILITTYEGTHNHPLPVSATAMASTTSAALSMLMTGSSTSGQGPNIASSASTNTATNLNGLNFYLPNDTRTKPFYFPNPSISSSPSYPTITLDLTSTSSTPLNRIGNFPSIYSSTNNLNFSSLESNSLPFSWSNGPQPFNKINQSANSLSFGTQPDETLYRSCMQKYFQNPNQQSHAPDTVAAATKAITSDPTFRSALAAALTSIIGSGLAGSTTLGTLNGSEKTSQSVKPSEPFPVLSSFPSMANASMSTARIVDLSSPSRSSQSGNLMLGAKTDQ